MRHAGAYLSAEPYSVFIDGTIALGVRALPPEAYLPLTRAIVISYQEGTCGVNGMPSKLLTIARR